MDAPALRGVAVRDPGRGRDCDLGAGLLTGDPWAVVEDPTVDVVVEVIGGLAPAAGLIHRAIELGKPVVTANKAVLGAFGPALRAAAATSGTPLHFEAAVAGAVPVIRGFAGLARADEIIKVEGVLNGTTTFVLSHMERTGATLEQAVAEARRLGYAEADVTRDLDGGDAADKLAVLVQCLFDEPLRTSDVQHFGIDRLGDAAAGPDRTWRLVATAVRGRCARVEPVPLRRSHPFAALTGPECAVTITGRRSGAITLSGPGAGGDATAASVLADLLAAADWVRGAAPSMPAVAGIA
jgi:homoserine dehydrogenase